MRVLIAITFGSAILQVKSSSCSDDACDEPESLQVAMLQKQGAKALSSVQELVDRKKKILAEIAAIDAELEEQPEGYAMRDGWEVLGTAGYCSNDGGAHKYQYFSAHLVLTDSDCMDHCQGYGSRCKGITFPYCRIHVSDPNGLTPPPNTDDNSWKPEGGGGEIDGVVHSSFKWCYKYHGDSPRRRRDSPRRRSGGPSHHWRNKDASNKDGNACAKMIGNQPQSQLELHSCDNFATEFAYDAHQRVIKVTSEDNMCVTAQRNEQGQLGVGSLAVLEHCEHAQNMETKGGDTAVQMYGFGDLCVGYENAPNGQRRLAMFPCNYEDRVMWDVLPVW